MKTVSKRSTKNVVSNTKVSTPAVMTARQSPPKTKRAPKDARWAVRSKNTDKVLFRGGTRDAVRAWRNDRGYQSATYLFDEQNKIRIR